MDRPHAGKPNRAIPRIGTASAWIFGLLLAAAAAVRLHALDRFSYWFDEIMQSYYLHGDRAYLWRALRFEAVHPPLDFPTSERSILVRLDPARREASLRGR